MLTKVRKYTSKLSPLEIKELLNSHKDPFYKFSINNRYETSASETDFKIKSMPASRRGIYRETHTGKISKISGQTEVELTSKLHKAGPIVVIALFVLFMSGMLIPIFANTGGTEHFANSKYFMMVAFMLVMHIVFYLVFIQLFSWIAIKWIENTLQLDKY